MKTTRAADVPCAQKEIQPPPFPSFEELDALAASNTSLAASAWWITHQMTEHVFSTITHGDPRTGAPLPRPLTEILRDIRSVTASGCRPFPHDCLLHVAEFAEDSLEHLLDRHRNRIVRSHEQLPFHQLREVDNRSVAWLARQPGRNIREKLSGRTHAMGVKRDSSADTTENRLLRSFAKLFVGRARTRLSYSNAYDAAPADLERIRRTEDFVRLCDERMRRSGLAEVPLLTRPQPNNVLLSDPHYSRVFRAWRWLRDDEESLRGSWGAALQRARTLLCWMVVAQLASRERVAITETICRVLTGRGDVQRFGVELLDTAADGVGWFLNPPLDLLIEPSGSNDSPFRIRVLLEGECVITHISTLSRNGLLNESSVSIQRFEVQARTDYCQPQRGVGIVISGPGNSLNGLEPTYADIAGLKLLSEQIAHQILQHCGVNPRREKPKREALCIANDARLGIEIGNASIHAGNGAPISLVSAPWALALSLSTETEDFEWLEGHIDRKFVIATPWHSLWATGDLLDADEQADVGMLVLASDRILGNLASELAIPSDARVAYTVPDAVDEFSQRSLRRAFSAAFHRPVPVWRSVAAAMALLTMPSEHSLQAGESVVIVDTEFSGASLTILTARYDDKLARIYPGSHGIYWERKPPLPPDEQLEMLGWPNVLRAYARMLVARALDSRTPDQQERIVDDLLRTDQISTLVEQGGSIFVQVVSDGVKPFEVIEIFDDPAWFDAAVARWTNRVDTCVKSVLSMLRKARAVLIGGPCAYSRFSRCGIQTGRIKFFNETKGFGFVIPDGGSELFFHTSSWASKQSPSANDLVAFEIGKGQKGPEAKRVCFIPQLTQWLRCQTYVTPKDLVEGVRACLLCFDSETPAWREWLPELSLEVVRDGHFGEIPLLERGTFVSPFLGESVQFTVPETLTLGRGHRWFLFPLLVGQQDRRPMAWEARLDAPSFPLDHDVRVRLKLAYRYGLENSYELVVEPESPKDAPFTRIEAKWVKGGDAAQAGILQEAPPFNISPWREEHVEIFLSAVRNLQQINSNPRFGSFLLSEIKKCWEQGRSIATAPLRVRAAFPSFREALAHALDHAPTINIKQTPLVFDVLCFIHEDAPDSIATLLLSLDDEASDDPILYRKVATMMAGLIGDGTGRRALILERLLGRFRRYTDADTFDGTLAGITIRELGNAAWRHPGFVSTLAAEPGVVARIIRQCRRSLQSIMGRLPSSITSENVRKEIGVRLAPFFRDSCELLLALLRIAPEDPAITPLRSGSPSADSFAKIIRQIDARFAALEVEVHWRVQLNIELPSELHRMSRVAFALNSYLSKGAGKNLIRVTGVETQLA